MNTGFGLTVKLGGVGTVTPPADQPTDAPHDEAPQVTTDTPNEPPTLTLNQE